MASRNVVSCISSAEPPSADDLHYIVTIDAETEMIRKGTRIISELRDEVEERVGIRIPLVWFVRFQRSWAEYLANDSADAFEDQPVDGYDGFSLARRELLG